MFSKVLYCRHVKARACLGRGSTYFLTQHITKPTRFREGTSSTVLDLIFTNEEHVIENIEFLPSLGKSDHFILEFEYICFSERVFSKHVHRKNFFMGNYEAIITKLSNTSWENLCSGTIDDSWNLFADILTRLINEHIPVCKESPSLDKKLPYINREIKDAIKKKNKAWRKYLYCKTIQNFDNYKLLRNKATSVIRNAKYSYEKELASNIKYD